MTMFFALCYWLASHLAHVFLAMKPFTETTLANPPLSPQPMSRPQANPSPREPRENQDKGGCPCAGE